MKLWKKAITEDYINTNWKFVLVFMCEKLCSVLQWHIHWVLFDFGAASFLVDFEGQHGEQSVEQHVDAAANDQQPSLRVATDTNYAGLQTDGRDA